MKWEAFAPANIALIKYMGKKTSFPKDPPFPNSDPLYETFLEANSPLSILTKTNLPLNDSLSFTLNHCITKVEILSHRMTKQKQVDEWHPLNENGFHVKLSRFSQKRFLNFFQFLKQVFHIQGFYRIRSGNNFPHSAGIASSASSFAALTLASYQLAKSHSFFKKNVSLSSLSQLSRLGSGSSCRSFFSPWSIWRGNKARLIAVPWNHLIHQVIIIEPSIKNISSSEAHQKVLSSPLFKKRPERASARLSRLLKAFKDKSWEACHSIVWEEFCDMHQLFETSSPPFSYQTPAVREALQYLLDQWNKKQDGPLVTMDAGICHSSSLPPGSKTPDKTYRKNIFLLSIFIFGKYRIETYTNHLKK